MASNIEATIGLLCSAHKLDRDKGLLNFERLLTSGASEESLRRCLQVDLMSVILTPNCCWEKKQGCLLALKGLIDYQNAYDDDFTDQVKELATQLLNDKESRVRLAAGAVLGALCRKVGPKVYINVRETLLTSIKENMSGIAADDPIKKEMFETVMLMDKLMSGPSLKREVTLPSQDATKLQMMETYLKTLEFIIEGCGKNFCLHVTDELVRICFDTLTHSNRYVRESGFYVLTTLLKACCENDVPSSIQKYEEEMCNHLACGLSDSWSQVRLSASAATRFFLLGQDEATRNKFYPSLLPRMCLNRYYAADGVRIYSQETWRQITGVDGRRLVELHIESTVRYYCESMKSNNSAVREAACSCMAELATKISRERVKDYAATLVMTLVDSFHDVSWPVRDAACLACGSLVINFYADCRGMSASLYPTLYVNLGDSVSSVRQSAASCFASVVRAFGESALQQVCVYLDDGLKGISQQKAEISLASPEKNCRGKRARELECSIDAYPGSTSVRVDNSPQPWQLADGCIHLCGELSNIKEAQDEVISRFPLLRDAGRYKHYSQHLLLLDTLCKTLPLVAKNVGKRAFSAVFEAFFDTLFYALESGNGSTSIAASQCLSQLTSLLGQNVVRAKIASYNPRYVPAFESVIFTAPF